MAAIEMPTYAEMIDAYHRANELQKQLDETRQELKKWRAKYSKLRAAKEVAKANQMMDPIHRKIIALYNQGITRRRDIAEQIGCSYGYVKQVLMDYSKSCKTTT